METVKLRELIRIKNGKDYRDLENGDIPVYGTGGVMCYVNDYLSDSESILLPRKGTLTAIQYVNGKFWTIDTIYWTEINQERVYPKYLFCYLRQLDLSALDSGSATPSMTFDSYYDLNIILPEMDIQKQIGDFWFALKSKIESNNNASSTLEAMAKLLYDYWFVQFDFPDENGRPYKSSGGKMVWNEELKREIPKGWEVRKFDDCISSINTGLNPRKNFVLNTGGTIKYFTVKNLTTSGEINPAKCDFIDEKARKIVHKRSDIKVGDILFASIAPLGRCHLISSEPKDWDINESVFSIRPNYENMTSEFLYMTFMNGTFIKQAEGNSAGSIFKGIRSEDLKNLITIVPPKQLLDAFSEQIKSIFELKQEKSKESGELTSLRDFLLPMLMNGQVTINSKNQE